MPAYKSLCSPPRIRGLLLPCGKSPEMTDSSDFFSAGASEYVRFRPVYPDDFLDWLTLLSKERDLCWDCACGSGQATVGIAKRFGKVIATDMSEAQLKNAPSLNNVVWRVATEQQSGIPDRSVDLVTVGQALHWLDQKKFWAECQRVLKNEGIVGVFGYGMAEFSNENVQGLLLEYYHEKLRDYWPNQRKMVERGYACVEFPFEEIEVPKFHIRSRWGFEEICGYCSSWSASQEFRRKTGEDPIKQLRQEFENVLQGGRVEVRWRMFARVGVFHVEQNSAKNARLINGGKHCPGENENA